MLRIDLVDLETKCFQEAGAVLCAGQQKYGDQQEEEWRVR